MNELLTDERLIELVPDVKEYILDGIFVCDIQPVRKQTEDLRKMVKTLVKIRTIVRNEHLKGYDVPMTIAQEIINQQKLLEDMDKSNRR